MVWTVRVIHHVGELGNCSSSAACLSVCASTYSMQAACVCVRAVYCICLCVRGSWGAFNTMTNIDKTWSWWKAKLCLHKSKSPPEVAAHTHAPTDYKRLKTEHLCNYELSPYQEHTRLLDKAEQPRNQKHTTSLLSAGTVHKLLSLVFILFCVRAKAISQIWRVWVKEKKRYWRMKDGAESRRKQESEGWNE